VHDLGLSYAREFSTALGKMSYEILERLVGLLGARPQVSGVPRTHIRALEVPHECVNLVLPIVDLTGRQVFKPRPSRVCEVQRQVADDHFVSGGTAQLAG
jgi:hypothetical protein